MNSKTYQFLLIVLLVVSLVTLLNLKNLGLENKELQHQTRFMMDEIGRLERRFERWGNLPSLHDEGVTQSLRSLPVHFGEESSVIQEALFGEWISTDEDAHIRILAFHRNGRLDVHSKNLGVSYHSYVFVKHMNHDVNILYYEPWTSNELIPHEAFLPNALILFENVSLTMEDGAWVLIAHHDAAPELPPVKFRKGAY